jgi:transcriptional regulator with XRE-family HTH domain
LDILNFVSVKRKPNKKFRTALGKRIRFLRTEQEISQEQLGYESGLHRDQIGRIELGKQSPSADNLEAIAAALNIKLKELMDFDY